MDGVDTRRFLSDDSVDSVDSLMAGIVDKCRKEDSVAITKEKEDSAAITKVKKPIRQRVKIKAVTNLDTSDEEEEAGEITAELKSKNRKNRILDPELDKNNERSKLVVDLTTKDVMEDREDVGITDFPKKKIGS